MKSFLLNNLKKSFFIFLISLNNHLFGDSFTYNSYNNHGSVGLINMPTARFYDEGVHGITVYDGTPDQKVTLISNPYNWFEASFFYTNVQDKPYPGYEYQDYKDKGFNLKIRLKKQDFLPAVAIGLNDFAGTGLYSSEYLVASYGLNNIDFHLGIGWGELAGSDNVIKNPLIKLRESFGVRGNFKGQGGSFNTSKFFSGKNIAPFYGISYSLNKNTLLKIEKDTINTNNRKMSYDPRERDITLGLDYSLSNNFTIGASFERGGFSSIKLIYKNNPSSKYKKYDYKKPEIYKDDNKYTKLIKNLEDNGIGVEKISETSKSLGLELTQFIHSDIALVEQIIREATRESGINKNIKKDIKIANLDAINEIDESFQKRAKKIYERETKTAFNTNTQIKLRPFLASREEFFKGALLVENDSEVILKENLFFNLNLKYSLANNFDDLRFPPVDVFPAQVRSDIKQYLKNMNEGVLIGRAQLDYHYSHKKNNHFMLTGGILEDMFSGYGLEYLYFKPNINYAVGFEVFNVKKRNYEWGFKHLDYENITYSANLYYRNYGMIPFDMKLSFGEYLAGDRGTTIEFTRRFKSGVNFGVFATFTDVSTKDFGEGSFDKGIFFNIPIYGNFINYTWRPLTKDPGAKLIRQNSLHDLLVRFQPLD